ncbi:DUF4129 domain-containing protein [Microbacterium sp. cf332]|uniref:DUF4129 domain-containing protein n=1 Tax=Microbacterium sp. cf332 TaxID=1761804 RepID=UPI00088EBF74|nr:DUF4129 domain-containing protein [Microbacterium sp. cf332]SDQ80233.1 protein of unknown function [Microbacterium sp. cf332]
MSLFAAPIAPDPDEARRWAESELSKSAYRQAEPTPIDRFARSVGEFFAALFTGQVPATLGPWLAVGAIVVLLLVVAAAIVIWGRPRAVVRSRAAVPLFGEDETRDAARLRRDAEEAARRDAWDEAVVLRVRALARGLAERTIVETSPGATVHRFAAEAARAFPASRAELDRVARSFDDVRYLRRPGTEAAYAVVRDLDERLAVARAEVPV